MTIQKSITLGNFYPNRFPLAHIEEGDHGLLFGAVNHILDKALYEVLEGRSMNAEDIRESWWEYLVVLYGILKTFQRNIRRDDW